MSARAHRSGVVEVSAERFYERFELLPPVGHRDDGASESFKCPEEIVAGIVDIFVRMEGQYLTFADSVGLPHAECCARVRASLVFRDHVPPTCQSPDGP